MVSRSELALAIINWVALFIPALAIMLNTLSDVYDGTFLETIGIAKARKQEIMKVSVLAFGASFLALILSLLYLLGSVDIIGSSLVLGSMLVLAVISIIAATAITTSILIYFYRAGAAMQIRTEELEEIAESDPQQAIDMLNMAGQLRQIDQQELNLITDKINIREKWKRQHDESSSSE